MISLGRITDRLDRQEKRRLSPRGARSRDAVRRRPESRSETEYRQPFSADADRILHSLAYTRYIDKTQVFPLTVNDHITHRALHVQLVSRIGRTAGRFLGLNEDLIEAIALGHDIGHPPFGHDGEGYLSALCRKSGIGHFYHSVQSVRFLDKLERKGRGWNLTLQTLDGILCHDGEIHCRRLIPQPGKRFSDLDQEAGAKKNDPEIPLIPMTSEGCVVRFADTFGYIGRDIEDAIRLGMICREDLPKDCAALLGRTNGTIVYTLVTDLITHTLKESQEETPDFDAISLRPEISDVLKELKRFNYERIYLHPRTKRYADTIEKLYALLFEKFMDDLARENRKSTISGFLSGMTEDYSQAHSHAEMVRDFIAGMTDQFFLRQCPESMRPVPEDP